MFRGQSCFLFSLLILAMVSIVQSLNLLMTLNWWCEADCKLIQSDLNELKTWSDLGMEIVIVLGN